MKKFKKHKIGLTSNTPILSKTSFKNKRKENNLKNFQKILESNENLTKLSRFERRKLLKLQKKSLRLVQQENHFENTTEEVNNPSQESFPEESSVNNEIDLQRQNLPIFPYQEEIVNAVRQNQNLVLIGETACGKTTQIPQFLYQNGLVKKLLIGVTQPRRVAAITIAQRVALEMNVEVGSLVGYSVRFQDVTSHATRIKYLTDGMLLRESINDPLLTRYGVIILDEAHERTIHTDIMFGVIKAVQRTREVKNMKPLKVIVMSATMDVDHFSNYFNDAPVFYLKGRQYPIQVFYSLKTQQDYVFAALVTAFQIHRKEDSGDILVFCTGQEEIESMVKSVKETIPLLKSGKLALNPMPLYANLPSAQQLKVFAPPPKGCRKIIFSTNIAETSVTIPGVKYVIDTGVVKARTYSSGSGLDLLKVQPISKAQAWQRAGRAGRESNGICYRLYTVKDFEELKDHTVPEIQRSNLANVVLQLLAVGVDDVRKFDFMDKPSTENIESAIKQLHLLGAIKSKETLGLTELGLQMVAFPLDPRLSKIVLMSKKLGCTDEILTILSLLSVDSVIHVPQNKREVASQVRRKFESNEGDHIMLLNLYKAYKSANGNKQWCQENFLNQRQMKIVMDVRKQLSEISANVNILPKSCGKDYSTVRRCLTYGLFMNAAEIKEGGDYYTFDTRQKVGIHPSSCLFNSKPSFVIFNELVQTTKCYMRNVCLVDPDWLMEAAPSYCSRKRLSSKN